MGPGFLLLIELFSTAYQLTLAPPAKIAPSRPTTATISFFIATTPKLQIPRKPRRGLPLVGLTVSSPLPGVNRSTGCPAAPSVANGRSLKIELDGVGGRFGTRLDLQLPVDIAQVRLDGALAETKSVGDGLVSLALDDHF